MLKAVLLFIVGLACLIKGGDWFVDGASALARKFKLPELLIGATVVSIGTTLPEVMVSTMSALSGHGEIAYGNAIGSVICNTALIAAITIAVKPGPADPKTLKVPVAFFYIAAAIYCVAAYLMGRFTRPMGLIMLAVFIAYMIVNVRSMKNSPVPEKKHDEEEAEEDLPMGKILLFLVAGRSRRESSCRERDPDRADARRAGVSHSADLRGAGNEPSGTGHSDHVSAQRTRCAFPGQCHRRERLQPGAGQRRFCYACPLPGSAERCVYGT